MPEQLEDFSDLKDVDIDKVAEALLLSDKHFQKKQQQTTCKNPLCDYKGQMIRIKNGYLFVAFLLLPFYIIPAIIYCIAHSGYTYICPKCGTKCYRSLLKS